MSTRTAATFSPPVMEARRWLAGVVFPDDRPLINVSQAAPVEPPPREMRQVMADIALNRDDAHLYGPVLGLPELRSELASQISAHYAGPVRAAQTAITSGCNQAFAAAVASLCSEGDEIIIPTPWYFNHKMWLDMSGVAAGWCRHFSIWRGTAASRLSWMKPIGISTADRGRPIACSRTLAGTII